MRATRTRHGQLVRDPLALLTCTLIAAATFAGAARCAPAAKAPAAPAAAPAIPTQSARSGAAPGMMPSGMAASVGLPAWEPPAEYTMDLVMTNEGQSVTMHRSISGAAVRSEMEAEGQKIIMIEKPDDDATYSIIPDRKMVMKMHAPAMMAAAGQQQAPADEKAASVKVTPLGTETLDGRLVKKFQIESEDASVLAWFDAQSSAPVRMEAKGSRIEWKNISPGPQPAKLFEIPKDYQVLDMDEQMKQIEQLRQSGGLPAGGMAGMPAGGAAMKGMKGGKGRAAMVPGGMPGAVPGGMAGLMGSAAGGIGGGLEGMAGNYGAQAGSNFGETIGQGIGATFGGPIGAMAGHYIGGRVGGWLGRRVATAVTPGGSH